MWIKNEAVRIFESFISDAAPRQINMSSDMNKQLHQMIEVIIALLFFSFLPLSFLLMPLILDFFNIYENDFGFLSIF